MLPLLLFVSAIVPGLLLVWYFHSRDASPVSARRLWTTFFYGCLCTLPAAALGLLLQRLAPTQEGLAGAAYRAFLEAGLAEELAKLLVLLAYSLRHRIQDPMDSLVYGATASLGFATLENLLYVSSGGVGTAALRAISSVPAHAFSGAIMGYFVGRARTDAPGVRGIQARVLGGLFYASLLHGLYDFGLMGAEAIAREGGPGAELTVGQAGMGLGLLLLTLTALITGAILTWRFVRTLQREQEQPEQPEQPEGKTPPPSSAPPDAAVAAERLQLIHQPSGLRWLWLLLGGVLLCVGVLFLAVAAFAPWLVEENAPITDRILGGLILGIPPTLLGWYLFTLGLRRLPRKNTGADRE